jgi:DNA polymerase
MNILYLDTETYSDVPIKHGAHRYAEEAEILLFAFAWNDDPVVVWDMTTGEHTLADIQRLIDEADLTIWHNSSFDRTVLRHLGVEIPVEKIEDTMVTALLHAFPGKLEQLGEALRLEADKAKDKDGKRLIHLFTKPRPKNQKLRRATRETHPDDWQKFISYAARDVDAMRSVRGLLPAWNTHAGELELWRLDQDINDRGICGDTALARAALRAFQRTSRALAADTLRLTEGRVASTTQRGALLAYLRDECGLDIPDMTGATVTRLLAGGVEGKARELLEIRARAAATSPAKYQTLLDAISSDGRLRGTIQFAGAARTARDAGRLVQLQNLPRSSLPHSSIELGIEAMKLDCEDLLFDNVTDLCTSAVRGLLVAAPGKKFLVADLSNIEGRMAAWLAGEQWKIEAFKAFDSGDGPDLYIVAYARSFGVSIEEVLENKKTGDGSMRQIGKVQELSLQYQGGEGAFRKMAGALAERLSSEEIQDIVRAWRSAHRRIQTMWYDLEGAARSALREGGSCDVRGVLRFDAPVDHAGTQWLRMRLPSGRFICYYRPKIIDGTLTYEGMNQITRKWERLDTYGGKFFEQACQASSRDVFMAGMRRAELGGLPVVLRVHDELVCEVPDNEGYSVARLVEMMATNPSWSAGLPLAADGFECKRYRK